MMNATTTALTTSKRKKLGRPTTFNTSMRRRLLRCISLGMPLTHVVSACRVSWSGFCEYRNRNPRFAEAVERARSRAMEKHLKIVVAAADARGHVRLRIVPTAKADLQQEFHDTETHNQNRRHQT